METALNNDFYTRCMDDPTVDPGVVANRMPLMVTGINVLLAACMAANVNIPARNLEKNVRQLHQRMIIGQVITNILLLPHLFLRNTQCSIGNALTKAQDTQDR